MIAADGLVPNMHARTVSYLNILAYNVIQFQNKSAFYWYAFKHYQWLHIYTILRKMYHIFFIIMQKFGLHNRAWVNFYSEQNHVWKKSYKNASGMEEYSEMWSYYVTSWLHKSICCDKCMMISYFLWLIYNNLVMSSRSYERLFIADYHTFPYDLMVQMNHLKRKNRKTNITFISAINTYFNMYIYRILKAPPLTFTDNYDHCRHFHHGIKHVAQRPLLRLLSRCPLIIVKALLFIWRSGAHRWCLRGSNPITVTWHNDRAPG